MTRSGATLRFAVYARQPRSRRCAWCGRRGTVERRRLPGRIVVQWPLGDKAWLCAWLNGDRHPVSGCYVARVSEHVLEGAGR